MNNIYYSNTQQWILYTFNEDQQYINANFLFYRYNEELYSILIYKRGDANINDTGGITIRNFPSICKWRYWFG